MNAVHLGTGSASESHLHIGQNPPTAAVHHFFVYLLGMAGTRLGSGLQENEPQVVPSSREQMVQEE